MGAGLEGKGYPSNSGRIKAKACVLIAAVFLPVKKIYFDMILVLIITSVFNRWKSNILFFLQLAFQSLWQGLAG